MPEYKGQVYRVEGTSGGWNPNPNEDAIPPGDMLDAENLNLHDGGRQTRGGTTEVNSTAIAATPVIKGVFQFRLDDGTEFIICGCTNGKVYSNYTTLLHTFATTGQKINFNVFNNTLYIWNGKNMPQTWDGAAGASSDLTNVPTSWSGTNYPANAIVHGRGASQSIWAYGLPENPKQIFVSLTATDDFSDANVTILSVQTEDGFGIVALEEFSEQLIAVGKSRPYIIDDSNSDRTKWGYTPAKWEGGVAHDRLLIKTPNDLIAMQEDGEIYSVIQAQSSGDFQAVSLGRPIFLHSWLKDNADMSKIDDFFGVYDRELRAIKIFFVRANQTLPDAVLVFYIDRQPTQGWMRHRYYATNFCSCAAVVRVAAGNWKIYTGGQLGQVWQLESTTISDDGAFFYNGFLTPEMPFDNPRAEKMYDRNWVIGRKLGSETIKAKIYIDGAPIYGRFNLADESGNNVVDESGNSIIGDEFSSFSFTFPADVALQRVNKLQNISAKVGRRGLRIQTEIFNDAVGEKMFVSQLFFDYTPLGIQAE